MRRLVARSIPGLAVAGVTALFFQPAWLVTVAIGGVVAAGSWWLGRCHHPRPLGLLPPTTDEQGNRVPARWFCEKCGSQFAATFEHCHAPIQRFAGFDGSKATHAARRKADFDQRQRQLAVRRAGMKQRPATVRPVLQANRPQPVPNPPRRLAG